MAINAALAPRAPTLWCWVRGSAAAHPTCPNQQQTLLMPLSATAHGCFGATASIASLSITASGCTQRSKPVRGTPGRKDHFSGFPECWMFLHKATRDQICQLSSFYLYNTVFLCQGCHMAIQYMAILHSDTESSASVSWGVQNVNSSHCKRGSRYQHSTRNPNPPCQVTHGWGEDSID